MSQPRYRNGATRELVTAIEQAGGTVERTANGHLRVSGPAGVAFLSTPSGSWRHRRKTRTTDE